MSAPDVSVVVCTRNRARSLARTLSTLALQSLPAGLTAELLVVDNGSRDGTAALVRDRRLLGGPARLVPEPAPGLSRARNAGLRAARGRVILFTDDDVLLPPAWLVSMATPLLQGRADAVAGSVRLAPHLERPWMEPFHRAALAATDLLRSENPGVMMGASMGFGRHVLDRVPAFDERLGAGALGTAEESLFAWQLARAGFSIGRVEGPAVEHWCDEDRLLRPAYLDAARKLGRSYAYIWYHWLHTSRLGLEGRSPLGLVRARETARLRLWRWRLRHPSLAAAREGITRAEFHLVLNHAYIQQFMKEYREPRRYRRDSEPGPADVTTRQPGEYEPSLHTGPA
ncbi:MAG TPA: glycosyltransferase family 2 protein [Longimicrobiaceae bacterium]|nr:glycosyltransferase family 2 protein [Longimicrobiaceae bacterium]